MSRHTDESWFLYFHKDDSAYIDTTDGARIANIAGPVYSNPRVDQMRSGLIALQFKDNVRVMAAGREMLRVLKHLADELDHGELPDAEAKMIWDVLEIAEPPLFNVFDDTRKLPRFQGTHDECFIYILKHQGQSVDYALKHGGWKIESV